jgi:hypothetical protein
VASLAAQEDGDGDQTADKRTVACRPSETPFQGQPLIEGALFALG